MSSGVKRRQLAAHVSLAIALWAVHPQVGGAQTVITYTRTAFSYIQNREVPAEIYEVRLEGGRLVVQRTEPNPGGDLPRNLNVAYQVPVSQLDVNRTAITPQQWDMGSAAMQLYCRQDMACARVTSNHSPWNGRTSKEISFLCRPDDCRRLEAALRNAATTDCNALRATALSGGQIILPAECQTDLDRATTYQPGAASRPRASGSPAPEPVIDGSKIPSQIDFPGRAPAPGSSGGRNESGARGPTPEAAPQPPVSERFDSLFEPSANGPTRGGASSESDVTRRFDSLLGNPRTVANRVEEVSAGIFDETVNRALTGGGRFRWTLFTLRDVLIDQVKSWGRNTMMRIKWKEDLPEEYRRDAAVVEAGLSKMLKGPSYRADVTLMNRVYSLFELHQEQ
jgi:hypothetical protein